MSSVKMASVAIVVGVLAAAGGVAATKHPNWQEWFRPQQPTQCGSPTADQGSPTTAELRIAAGQKIKEVDGQIPIVRAHVQTLQAKEVAAKYAVYAANEMLNETKWPCTFGGVRIETRGDAYRALVAVEDKQKKIRLETTRFSASLSALTRVREDLEDKLRTLDLVDANQTVIDGTEFAKQIDSIKIPNLPVEPAAIDLPAIDLAAIK